MPLEPVSQGILWLLVLVYFLLAVFTHEVFALGDASRALCRATGNLFHPTLANYLPLFAVLTLCWWKLARLGPADLGLVRADLPRALLWVLGFWVTAQLGLLVLQGGPTTLHPYWDGGMGATTALGSLLGQVLGNALYEELFWRGFVLVQLSALLVRRRGWSRGRALLLAALVSSALFALSHLPRDLQGDRPPGNLMVLQGAWLAGGLVFSGIYVLSGNLFMAVLFHSLVNQPTALFEGPGGPAAQSFYALGPLLLLALLRLRQRARGGSVQQPGDG